MSPTQPSTAIDRSDATAEDLAQRFEQVRRYTTALCKPLRVEDHVVQPVADVSPPKWHLGHTTWFFEQFILRDTPGYRLFDTDMAFMFNSYYETVGRRVLRAERGNMTRPGLDEVHAYRRHVDEGMRRYLASGAPDQEALGILELGLHHEQQHQELLLMDLKYILGHNPLFPEYGPWPESVPEPGTGALIDVTGGVHEIGHKGSGFSFDNEHGRHKVWLDDFAISDRLVTAGEYLDFMRAGGYTDFNFWHSDGWQWVQDQRVRAPLYWHEINGVWHQYTLQGLEPVDPALPLAHVSFYEAFAYAEWKGMRLPTEAEWEVASPSFRSGQRWEWTHSAYLPYPGYRRAPGALGEYNGKFMVNQMVLRGASSATPPGHSRPTYRNFFHPHLRWLYSGVRLVGK